MDHELLAIEELSVSLEDRGRAWECLRRVSVRVSHGDRVGVVGRTGSGKSMLLRTILGMLPPGGQVTGGDIRFRGESLVGLPERKYRRLRGREMALVPQHPLTSLNPVLSIERQFFRLMKAHDVCPREDMRAVALERLHDVGLYDPPRVMSSHVSELSGGIAQRVVMAMVLSLEPELILADEPTTALDVTIQRDVLDRLIALTSSQNRGLCLVTHDLGVVAQYCDKVLIVLDGEIVESGDVDEVLVSPKEAYTSQLLGSALSA